MTKQKQAAEAQSEKKRRPQVEPVAVAEPSGEVAGLTALPGGPLAAAGDGTMQAQAARLGDPRLQSVQRQALAGQIGRLQGNRHLQIAVTGLKQRERPAPYQPKNGNRRTTEIDVPARSRTVQRAAVPGLPAPAGAPGRGELDQRSASGRQRCGAGACGPGTGQHVISGRRPGHLRRRPQPHAARPLRAHITHVRHHPPAPPAA